MRNLWGKSLVRRARSLSAFACLLALSMQLALPLLHQAHGGHDAHIVATHEGSGFLQANPPHPDRSSAHEPATCPQCRMLSQSFAPALRTTTIGAPGVCSSRLDDRESVRFHGALSGHEGPPRAPPLPA